MFFNDRHISYNIRVLHISSTKIIRMQVKERSFVLNMTYENMFFFLIGWLMHGTVCLTGLVLRGVARIFGLGGRRYHVRRSLTQRAPSTLWINFLVFLWAF